LIQAKLYSEIALKLPSNNLIRAVSFINLARAYQAEGDYTKSLEYFQQALICNPDSPVIHFGIGQSLAFNGQVY
jgi:tetratricopeptide (TPR) repeat protein